VSTETQVGSGKGKATKTWGYLRKGRERKLEKELLQKGKMVEKRSPAEKEMQKQSLKWTSSAKKRQKQSHDDSADSWGGI